MPRLLTFLLITTLSACHLAPSTKDNYVGKKQWQLAVKEKVNKYKKTTKASLQPLFSAKHLNYPPQTIALLAFKQEKSIELWAKDPKTDWRYIKNYPLTANSGILGPKLAENDRQIPEGLYKITRMNPYSALHLSMMINYPNAFDRKMAAIDGREKLGDNIFIHGKALSAGCLAVGDKSIDELFVLANLVGKSQVEVVIAPNDLRKTKALTAARLKTPWVARLYRKIATRLATFKRTITT